MGLDLDDCGERGLSRAQVADAMDVKLPTLDSWLAQTRTDRNIPVAQGPDWVRATGSRRLLEWFAAQVGLRLVEPHVAEIGEAYIAVQQAKARLRDLTEVA